MSRSSIPPTGGEPQTAVCATCGQEKPRSAFNSRVRNWRTPHTCNACASAVLTARKATEKRHLREAKALEKARRTRQRASGPVYLASPIACYETPRYDRLLKLAQAAYPHRAILPARSLYANATQWRCDWPNVHLPHIGALCFFANTDGTIGKGVFVEIQGALKRGLSVKYLTDDGRLLPFHPKAVQLGLIAGGTDWRRYAEVVLVDDAGKGGQPC